MMSNRGRLIGVGVGPGDPRMVTIAAVEAIAAAPVVAYPVKREGAGSRALETVRRHVDTGTRLLPLLMPMTRELDALEAAHGAAARELSEAADSGDVVYLSLGDPLFYSTFSYLAARFPGEVEVVSGVTAMSAMAAAVGLPVAAGDIPTVIATGGDRRGIKAALDLGASLVIIKPRALSEKSLDMLEREGALSRAHAVIELGGERQRLLTDVDRASAAALPYFAVLWIQPGAGES